VLLDREFNESATKAALKQRYSLVHIASHFVFKPSDKESFLLLGGNEHLTLDQVRISSTPFFDGVELLVLSACDTATGGGSNGKEVESFAVLAQRQGAKAVMATLWPVADRSTQELMRRFYENRVTAGGVLRERMTKAEALRQAQLALLRGQIKGQPSESRKAVADSNLREFKADPNALWSHPYYWAPFVLIGNWK
jgi:CHAT domain-containing protein